MSGFTQIKAIPKQYPKMFGDYTSLIKPDNRHYDSDFHRLVSGFNAFKLMFERDIHYIESEPTQVELLAGKTKRNINYDYVCFFVEDYSMNSVGRSILQIAEMKAAFNLAINEVFQSSEFYVYEVSPNTVKKFITGDGHASKEDVKASVNKLGYYFDKYDCGAKTSVLAEDLYDAFSLAKFGHDLELWFHGHDHETLVDFKKDKLDVYKR